MGKPYAPIRGVLFVGRQITGGALIISKLAGDLEAALDAGAIGPVFRRTATISIRS